jgi:hypothetical protein
MTLMTVGEFARCAPRRVLLAALAFVLVGAMPSADPALITVLQQGRATPDGSFSSLSAQIAALPQPEGDALAYWLGGHGRGPLHALGVTDQQIGIPFFPIDYQIVPAPWPASVTPLAEPVPTPAPTPQPRHRSHFFGNLLGSVLPDLQIPIASSSSSSSQTTTTTTPNSVQSDTTSESSSTSVSIGGNPWAIVGAIIDAAGTSKPQVAWRNLVFASSTLGMNGSNVDVTHGFAAVRNDGTEGLACVSFVNRNAKVATEVDVDLEILDALGYIRRVEPLRLSGTFQPGAEIGGPQSVEEVQSARQNCAIDGERSLSDPTDPFSAANAVVYSVRSVRFADGTSWSEPGANPWTTP